MASAPNDAFEYKSACNISSVLTIEKMHMTISKAKSHAQKLPTCIGFCIENNKKPVDDKEYLCHFKEGDTSQVQDGMKKWHTYLCPPSTGTEYKMAEEKGDDFSNRAPILLLFDVDGTLTASRLKIKQSMWSLLQAAKSKLYLGFVGGSDFPKQQEQLHLAGDILKFFDFCFSENGLCAWENGKALNSHNLKKELTEDEIATFVDFCLLYIADLKLPKKRGTFVEFRNGMINVCPVGRNCSQAERVEFFEYDKKERVREKMIEVFERKLPDLAKKLKCSIGGQISFDVFPHGWDKTYCLRFVEKKGFKEIHFFGDKTHKGGNDYEIFEDDRTIGHTVKSPGETEELIKQILAKLESDK